MPNVGTLTAHLEMDTNRLRKGMIQGRNQMRQFTKGAGKGIGSLTSSVGKLGAALGALGGAFAAFRLIKDITRVGEEFEQTITTAGAVMRATAEEMQALNDIAREMGETTEFTASQAAGSLKFLGMAGFNAAKAMAALPDTLDLATAGGIDLSRAADIATNALTAMRLPVEQLGRVNDVFVGTITRSNTNMEQMAQAFKYAAPIAAAYGYKIEELSGLIGMLGNAGVQGSMAGTQLAQAFIEAREIAQEFGFESGDLIDVLDSLKNKFGENVNMMEFFTRRSGRAALILSAAGDKVKEFQETLGDVGGEAKTLADVMRSTFGGMHKELISVIESIKIDVFGLYRDSLKDTMRDTISWLRDNREQILIWASGIIDAFKIAATVIKDFVMVIATAVKGLGLIFDIIQTESRATSKIVVKDANSIANAFTHMNTTPLDEFFNSLANFWNAAVLVTQAAAEMLGTQLGAIASFVVDGLIGNFIKAFEKLVTAVVKFSMWDFSGAFGDIKKAGSSMADMWDAAGVAGKVAIAGWSEDYQKMVDGFDFRSKADKIIDEEFKKTLAKSSEVAASALAQHREKKDMVHQAKAVAASVLGGDEVKAAKEKMDVLKKITKQWMVYFSHEATQESILLDVRVAILADLLSAEVKSKEERIALWDDYRATRIEQMRAEHKALLDVGMDIALVTDVIAAHMAKLNAEQRDLFTEQASWMREWAAELSAEMNYIFSDMFFDAMKGEWQSLTEYMSGIWDLFLRKIANSAADELSGLFGDDGLFSGIGKLFGGDKKIPTLASGGLVNRPTLAVIGESGPEAIIPLSKMRDENFLAKFGVGGESGGNVSITIQTPDLPSFQRSQQQIMTQAAIALRRARMRNG